MSPNPEKKLYPHPFPKNLEDQNTEDPTIIDDFLNRVLRKNPFAYEIDFEFDFFEEIKLFAKQFFLHLDYLLDPQSSYAGLLKGHLKDVHEGYCHLKSEWKKIEGGMNESELMEFLNKSREFVKLLKEAVVQHRRSRIEIVVEEDNEAA